MAIAYDTSLAGLNWSVGDPQTFSYTCTGTDRLFIATVFTSGATVVNGITHGGTAMTQLSSSPITDLEGNEGWTFYLAGPATGSQTVSVDLSTSTNCSVAAASYTGVDQTTPIEANVSEDGTASAGSYTSNAVTVTTSGAWLVGCFRDTDGSVVSSSTLTKRVQTSTVQKEIWDSNGTVATGSQSVTYTISPNGRLAGHHLLVLKPASGSATVNSGFFNLM